MAGAGVQVSHHPPVGAAHAENKDWEYDMVSAPTTKFLGNSIDIYPIGQFLVVAPPGVIKSPCLFGAWSNLNGVHATLCLHTLCSVATVVPVLCKFGSKSIVQAAGRL